MKKKKIYPFPFPKERKDTTANETATAEALLAEIKNKEAIGAQSANVSYHLITLQ